MNPNMSVQLAIKLALVGVTIVGIFVLAAMGKLDAAASIHEIVVVVAGLTVALGISGGLSNGAAQLVRGQSAETGPAVVVHPSLPPPLAPLYRPSSVHPPSSVRPTATTGAMESK